MAANVKNLAAWQIAVVAVLATTGAGLWAWPKGVAEEDVDRVFQTTAACDLVEMEAGVTLADLATRSEEQRIAIGRQLVTKTQDAAAAQVGRIYYGAIGDLFAVCCWLVAGFFSARALRRAAASACSEACKHIDQAAEIVARSVVIDLPARAVK